MIAASFTPVAALEVTLCHIDNARSWRLAPLSTIAIFCYLPSVPQRRCLAHTYAHYRFKGESAPTHEEGMNCLYVQIQLALRQ